MIPLSFLSAYKCSTGQIRLMDDYGGFADRYDLLYDWDRRRRVEEQFFRRLYDRGIRSVLDCHCGTGFHCAVLSEMGFSIDGVDRSPAMLQKAFRRLTPGRFDGQLYMSDVKDLGDRLSRRYDCVISMGNSLPHEFGDENILKALKGMHGALKDNGTCVIHMENFDALCRDRERFIPSRYARREKEAEAFVFAIDYSPEKVIFNILSFIERNGHAEFHVDTVEYNPVTVARMEQLLSEAGFGNVDKYCDFSFSPFGSRETYDVIYVAEKA